MKDEKFFGKDIEKIRGKNWDWNKFASTKKFPISKHLLDWVIGQDFALKECFLCLDEWRYKLKYLQKKKWYKPWLKIEEEKPIAKQMLTPGPYLLLLGDPGTGKSLMGRAMAEKLTQVYKKDRIKMFDIVSWPNKVLPSTPHISIHETGEGKTLVIKEKRKFRAKSFFKGIFFKAISGLLLSLGVILLGLGMYNTFMPWIQNWDLSFIGQGGTWIFTNYRSYYEGNFFLYFKDAIMQNAQIFALGGTLSFSGAFLYLLPRWMGNMGGKKGIGGAESTNAPKLLIDNSNNLAPFIDATGHTSSQLFGSIAWDPYQTGGLGCYDSNTRLFTTKGFKEWDQIKLGDLVYSLNKNEELEILPVKKILIAPYKGHMIKLKTQTIDLLLTPDHKVFYKKPYHFKGLRIAEADNLPKNIYLPLAPKTKSKNIQLENRRRFVTSNIKARDNFIKLCIQLGYPVTFKYIPYHNTWLVQYSKNKKGYLYHAHRSTINYSGIVWCVHLEKNHNVLVERNGKMIFCGQTPEHQRVTAGDVHRASLGILYIDEIKNLKPEEAITLLTVLEDGQLPITMRDRWHGGGTSAMAVSTEPIPCMTFLVAAGNFDSIGQIHPALMDRLVGYGKVVRMSNDMSNTLKNRRKYVQFITQESKRFHLPPFSKSACIEIVREGRRKSNKRYKLTTKFRPLISIIKTAGTLAKNDKSKIVESKHVLEAINEHCKTIQKQLLEHEIEERGQFMEIVPEGSKLGTIYGLAVVTESYSKEMTGSLLRVKASMDKVKKKHTGSFEVTGVAKESKWIEDSAKKVKSVILKKYGVDISQDYNTHIDFSQAYGVDGPSAGVTMTILLCSLLEGKPIKQDVAVTGEINITSTDKIEITAVGGIHEKIKAAEGWKFKKVIIPQKNFQLSINPSEYKIKIIGGKTLSDYLKEVLVNRKDL